MVLRDLADVRRYDGAQSAYAEALQRRAHDQHPRRVQHGEKHPAQHDKRLEQYHTVTIADRAGQLAGGQRTDNRAHAEQRTVRLYLVRGYVQRAFLDQQYIGRQRPSQDRAHGHRSDGR